MYININVLYIEVCMYNMDMMIKDVLYDVFRYILYVV